MKTIIQILLAAAMMAFAVSAFAQGSDQSGEKKKKETAKSYIEISGGISVPVGKFASSDYSDLRSGFAGVGPIIAISGVKYIHHSNFGIGGTISYANYGMKNMKNVALGYQSDYDVDSVNEHNTSYTSVHALIGPYYSIPCGMVTIDFHALGGINAMWSPQMDILLEDGGNSYTHGGTAYTFWQESTSSVVLATQLGTGIRISPVKHLAVAVRVDYFNSRPVFNLNWEYANPQVGRYLTSYTQPFNGINASIGLDYVFGK